jgi:hypothetical protein
MLEGPPESQRERRVLRTIPKQSDAENRIKVIIYLCARYIVRFFVIQSKQISELSCFFRCVGRLSSFPDQNDFQQRPYEALVILCHGLEPYYVS